MAQWWSDYKKTELSWADWKQQSKKLRSDGLNKEEIFKSIGVPIKDGEVIKVTTDGRGGYKPRTGQREEQGLRRTQRISGSREQVNKLIREEAAAQWDELVGDRNTTIDINGKPYSFKQYLNKEVRDHTKFTRQKAVEAVNLGKSLGHGTPTTDVGRYAESYTQQFAQDAPSNYEAQDYIPPDQAERLRKAGLAVSPQEAAKLHVGTTNIGGRLPDPKIENLLKIEPGSTKIKASKLMPDRNALRAMATAGLLAPSVLGTTASAAETTGRVQLARQTNNPVDWAQAGLAGVSSLGDIAGYTAVGAIPGEVVSTVADLANVAIDTARTPAPRPSYIPKAQARPRTTTAARTQGQAMPKPSSVSKPLNLANEAQYFIVNPIRSAFDRVFGNRGI